MSSRRKPAASRREALPRPANTPLRFLLATALVLAFLVHVAALWYPFVDDDVSQIQLNPHVQSWQFLPRYFTADVWSQTGCGSNYYRPIFLVWLRLNHSVFGLEPMGWHAAAILLHVLAAFLVYLLAARELNDKIAGGFAAAIFAVHPITLESVAFVSGATESLQGVLFLGCLLCHFKGSRRSPAGRPGLQWDGRRPEAGHRKAWRAAALLLFALALLNKETAIILPLFLVIYEARESRRSSVAGRRPGAAGVPAGDPPAWNVKRETKNVFRALAPYLAVIVVYLAVRAIALHGIAPGMKHASTATVIATWPAVLWFYVHKLAAPWPLSLDYGLGFTTRLGLRNFGLPLAALLALAAGLWAWFRRDQRIATVCAWFLIPLLPAVAGILRFDRGQLVHDRYLYLPLVGFAMLCALALRSLSLAIGRWPLARNAEPSSQRQTDTADGQRIPLIQALALLLIVSVFGITTVKYIGNWSSDMAVYTHALAVSPDDSYAHNSIAEQLFNHRQFDEAMAEFKKALDIDPQNTFSRTSLAQAYGYFGRWDDEIAQMRIVAGQLQSSCAYANLADAQQKIGHLAEAESYWRRALALSPCPPHGHWSMAQVLRQEGKLAEARAQYQAEMAEPSDDPIPGLREQIDELDRMLGSPSSH